MALALALAGACRREPTPPAVSTLAPWPVEVLATCNGEAIRRDDVQVLLQPDETAQVARQSAGLELALDGAVVWQALSAADRRQVTAAVQQEQARQEQLHGTPQNWLANLRQHGQSLAAWQLAVRTDRGLDVLNHAALELPIDASVVNQRWSKTRGRFVQSEQVLLSELVVPQSSADGEQRLAEARQRLSNGEAFSSVAAALSQVPSAPAGGDRGWTGVDRLDPRLARALAGLRPGQLSTAVRTDFGWHLLLLRDRRPAQALDWAQARPLVEALLRNERAFVLRRHKLAELRNAARIVLAPPQVR